MKTKIITIAELKEIGYDIVRDNCVETGIGCVTGIDWDMYQAMCESGVCVVHGAFDGRTLVGYAVYICSRNPKDVNEQCANCDVIYMNEEHRPRAIHFLNASERLLKARGVGRIIHQIPIGLRFARAMERHGYQATQTVYEREL